MPRETIDLSGSWRLQLDPQNEGERAGWAGADYDDGRWREVSVPCSLERGHPDIEWYVGAGWYRRRFHVPQSWEGRRVALRFEGVNYHAAVWVNGQLIGRNEDGFLPFELPVFGVVRYGGENVLVVRADNEARPGEAPGANVGWRPYGGILREVTLEATENCHIAHVAYRRRATAGRRGPRGPGGAGAQRGRAAPRGRARGADRGCSGPGHRRRSSPPRSRWRPTRRPSCRWRGRWRASRPGRPTSRRSIRPRPACGWSRCRGRCGRGWTRPTPWRRALASGASRRAGRRSCSTGSRCA